MRRSATFAAIVVLGIALGACSMLAVDDARPDDSRFRPRATPPFVEPVVASDPVLLVWTHGGLPPGLAASVAGIPDVTVTTEVRGDLVEMIEPTAPEGFVVPLDAFSVDPATYASFLPKGAAATIAALQQGEAVLGETSARLRRIGPGGDITLADGQSVRVAAVLDDALVGAAELLVAHGTIAAIDSPRFLLVAYEGPRATIEHRIRDYLPPAEPVRFRAPGETPLLRHGDAVLPQALVKEQFGEFAYRRLADEALEIDPAWVAEHIVDAEMPLIGPVRCHRAIVDELRTTLVELEQRNLAYVATREGYRGCFVPRLISPDGAVSRHTWGVALDVNYPKNVEGELGTQDPRLVDAMAAHGFTWGGPWLRPDPAHFEWVSTSNLSYGD